MASISRKRFKFEHFVPQVQLEQYSTSVVKLLSYAILSLARDYGVIVVIDMRPHGLRLINGSLREAEE
jgi:hypothetical protein